MPSSSPAWLTTANQEFVRTHPGESGRRQPVHTVYGGAHLFKAEMSKRLGGLALRALNDFAPNAATLAYAVGSSRELSETVYPRVIEKLNREPVEDFRIDFEDGYGNRPDDEEDATALSAAAEVAKGLAAGHAAALPRHPHQTLERRAESAQLSHAASIPGRDAREDWPGEHQIISS
jgi:hypothetical protein